MTWTAAQDYCRAKYTDLAIILSNTDWLRLNKVTISKGLATYVWAGLWNDVNSWRWSLGDIPLQSGTYTNWYTGEPGNNAPGEACIAMGGNDQWWDVPCTQLRAFVCYDVKFSGASRFISITNPVLTWIDARAYCRQHHTDLAISFSSSDNSIIGQVSGIYDPWIGLYRDTWKWSDGTNATNLPWIPGQPDNSGGVENCAVVYNDLLNDVSCTSLYGFFCHTNFPTRSQTVRLQVKSDWSVFDPSVQSSILDQIKQKLKKNGILETTVTWSVMPDGNIFHKKKRIS
ncbi:putative C-type lectin domain family 20 member A isoform X2 [Clarias gariepinus]|uniref:putative C-type lectin domain family 20 member A isoform X2 n=1 Tax=Clarias gariepinus TaxID=13013 RepID=UPI00234E2CD9|nr:putative C-type lectin domain family 20 member A isoform X2 [Clarias gariepinus]